MKQLEKLIWKQLDEYMGRDKLTMSDLEIVHKLTDTIKNILKIEALGYDEEMSGRHYVRGHYSRDGRNSRNASENGYGYGERYGERYGEEYGEGRYSRTGVVDRLEKIMREAPDKEKAIIRKAIQQIDDR